MELVPNIEQANPSAFRFERLDFSWVLESKGTPWSMLVPSEKVVVHVNISSAAFSRGLVKNIFEQNMSYPIYLQQSKF